MGSGKLSDRDLARCMAEVERIPGDYAEVGVYRGHLFDRLAWVAYGRGLKAHAFDSFAGMGTPGTLDGTQYPRGALRCSADEFIERMTAPRTAWEIWQGYVPACFAGFHEALAFAYIDLDHYRPTSQALAYIWPLITPGGMLALDDYFPGRGKLATPAIERFLLYARRDRQIATERVNRNNQLFLTRAK